VIEFRSAIAQGLAEAMEADDTVLHFGEDIAVAGGVFKVTEGLLERFGAERVFDTPISELAMAGAAFGSAATGLRPIVEIMFGDFMALPMDSLINQAAKYWYLSNEKASAPLVIRTAVGAGGRFGAIHSQNPGTWLLNVPGIKIVCPSTPSDARALARASVEDNNPVVFLEHKRLYSIKGEVRDVEPPIGKASIVREGRDVTIVSIMKGVHDALAAADELAAEGIEAEVIDLRSLRPMDAATVIESVEKTNRLVCVEEGPRLGGWAVSLVAAVSEDALHVLDDVWTLTTADGPIPFSPPLEDDFLPGKDRIVGSVRERAGTTV
jgi:pyruvate/2-oxoglutarate/acetoin dehydrogenase E1 component